MRKSFVILFVVILALDQLTKYFANTYLVLGSPVPVIPDLFNFTLVYNPGAAFGMFAGLPDVQRRLALGFVQIIAIAVVFRFLVKDARDDLWAQHALVAVLAGAVGNIIDRLRYDAVIDFLDFYVGSYHWPAFNVADSAISVGVVVLILRMLFKKPIEANSAVEV